MCNRKRFWWVDGAITVKQQQQQQEEHQDGTNPEDKGPYMNWDTVLLDEHDKHLIMIKAYEYGLSRHVSHTRKQMRKIEKINAKIAESKKEAKGRK